MTPTRNYSSPQIAMKDRKNHPQISPISRSTYCGAERANPGNGSFLFLRLSESSSQQTS